MSAVHVEVEVVKFFKLVALFIERFDDRFAAVVKQQNDVRKLDGRVLAYGKARRNAVRHHSLRGADRRLRRMHIGILLEIDRRNYAEARIAVGGFAAHEHKAVFQRTEDAVVEIALHGGVDGFYPLLRVAVLEVDFRKDEIERAGRVAYLCGEFVPILSL